MSGSSPFLPRSSSWELFDRDYTGDAPLDKTVSVRSSSFLARVPDQPLHAVQGR